MTNLSLDILQPEVLLCQKFRYLADMINDKPKFEVKDVDEITCQRPYKEWHCVSWHLIIIVGMINTSLSHADKVWIPEESISQEAKYDKPGEHC